MKRDSPQIPRRRARGAKEPTVRELHRKPPKPRPPPLPARAVARDGSLEELDLDAEAQALGLIAVTPGGSSDPNTEPSARSTPLKTPSNSMQHHKVAHLKQHHPMVNNLTEASPLPPPPSSISKLDPIMQSESFSQQMHNLPQVR